MGGRGERVSAARGAATRPNRRADAGWWVLLATGGLLLLDGAWLVSAVRTPAVFAQDTGVALADVAAAFPRVIDVMHARGTLIGVLLCGLGALVVVLAWAGRREASRTAWVACAVVAALLLSLAAVGFAAGSVAVGAVYLVLALAMGAGLALVAAAR